MLKSLFAGFVCLYFLTPIAYAAEIYEWRDAQGEEHMADTPPPCRRVGDGHCGNDAHLRAHHDPRVHAQHHAAHAHAHR